MDFDLAPLTEQTWLVCGGRDFSDWGVFGNAMSDLVRLRGCPATIVHGGASGADAMAHKWASDTMHVRVIRCPAAWDKHGKAAGPIRNQAMLDAHKPDLVVAFPGGVGTADVVARARKAGISIAEIQTKQ